MFVYLWNTVLYLPLLNALIYFYNTIAGQNLGWAVVWLTVVLRLALLPFSVISILSRDKHERMIEEAQHVSEVYRNDPVLQKEEVRRIMKKNKISPWARTLTLVVQAIVFLVLYEVFIHGISGEQIARHLYPSVNFPGKLSTNFYGFDLGQTHTVIWPAIAGGYLLISSLLHSLNKKNWEKSDLYFLIFFPLSVFAVLWFLPMVKSLFILTTALFSDTIGLGMQFIFPKKKSQEHSEVAPSK
jgi:YidC/Oxa1 family membrane protein insertase